jgi:branched-chain amino acid transport system substrate-binding protein
MPELLNGTGAAQWGDVENHPWTTGMQIDYFTEASLWAEWLKKEYPNGAKVAAITFNNDFGKSYSKGFKSAIKGSKITLVDEEFHDPTAPNIDNQYTTVAATGADVLLLQTTGTYCTQGMADVEKGASWKPKVIMSATCASLTQFFKPLIDQGLTGKDTYIVQYLKDVNDPAMAADPIVKLFKDTLTAQGLDPKQSTYATGWIFAWFMTEILKEADSYKGGLNRGNIMIAARSITQTNPFLIEGLTSKMDGMKDAYLMEGGQIVKYTVTDPKTLGSFVKAGDLINLEGKLGTYATVVAAG